MIEINNVSKLYGKSLILDRIDMSLENGNVYGIVGANGAGKTTLFKCICGLTDYLGKIKSTFTPLKNHVAYLPTTPYVLDRITGYEYLQLFANARKQGEFDEKKSNFFDLPLNQYVSTYSTGMIKKLALQAILLQRSEVIILDEPFNGVDIQSNMVIVELIKLLKQKNKLVIIASHIFETLNSVCDYIYLLDNKTVSAKYDPSKFIELEKKLRTFIINDAIYDLDL